MNNKAIVMGKIGYATTNNWRVNVAGTINIISRLLSERTFAMDQNTSVKE